MPWQPPWMETGPHQSNNSHGSIQRRWQHFLEVHNQSAQSYCVITQKAEPWDLIWTSSAALSPVSAIQNQIKGQHFFCPLRREITIILNAEHFSIAWNLSLQTLCWPAVGKSCFLRVINVFYAAVWGRGCSLNFQLKVLCCPNGIFTSLTFIYNAGTDAAISSTDFKC